VKNPNNNLWYKNKKDRIAELKTDAYVAVKIDKDIILS
jgi:hypothetical protein